MNGDYAPTVVKLDGEERKKRRNYAYPAIFSRSGGYFIKGSIKSKFAKWHRKISS